jgi:hypothetical protein
MELVQLCVVGDGLRLTIYACYSWDTVLNAGLEASFHNKEELKLIRQKAEEVNSMRAYIGSDKNLCSVLNWCCMKSEFDSGQMQEIFSFQQCQNRLWGPSRLLSNAYRGFYPGRKAARA